jgi:hypothetical protein
VNRKQRQRRLARRRAHAAQKDRPRNIMSRASYSPVKQGHIVPVVYQRNFAIRDQITLHVDHKPGVLAAIQNTATRGPFYRRIRPDGSEIDDVEASLSYIEGAVSPVFDDLLAAAPMTRERKQVLAQFFGIQMVRGPAFVEQRRDVIDGLVSGLDATQFPPSLLREVGGDLAIARERVRDAYLSTTQQVITMLTTSLKLASVIGSMRWHLLRFTDPILPYSDHPVVVWPMAEARATPFPKPKLAPMAAIEVRAPISPQLALLMTLDRRARRPSAGRGQPATRRRTQRIHHQPGRTAVDAPARHRAARRRGHDEAALARVRDFLHGRHCGGLAPSAGGRALPASRPQEAVPVRHRDRGRISVTSQTPPGDGAHSSELERCWRAIIFAEVPIATTTAP